MNSRLRLFLRVVIGVALLGWLVRRTGFGLEVVEAPEHVLPAVGATAVVLVLAQALSAWRWQLLLGPNPPSWLDLFRIYLVAQFTGLFLPTSVGGDVLRIAAVSRARPAALTVSSVFLDRALGLVALLVYLVIGLFTAPATATAAGERLRWSVAPPWLLAAALLAVVLVLLAGRLRALARVRAFVRATAVEVVGTARRHPRRFGAALVLSFVIQASYIVAWRMVAAGLALGLPWPFLLFAVPFVSLAMMVPVTIAGLGVREGVWALLVAPLGYAGASGVALGLLYLAAFSVVGGAGGVWLVVQGACLRPAARGRAAGLDR